MGCSPERQRGRLPPLLLRTSSRPANPFWSGAGPCRRTAHTSPDHALALDEHRTLALRALALAHDAEALGHLGIGFEQAAEIAAEAVLVELLVRLDVPQPARIGGDLVRHHDAHGVVLPQPPGLHLEIDQADADAEEDAGEEVVDADGERHHVVDLLGRRPADRGDVLLGDHRIAELVVLVIELDDRARQLRAFLDAEALRQGAGRDIAHNHLDRNDLDLANQLLTHVEPADEVGGNADVVEMLEDVFGDPVVEYALAFDDLVLLCVERGRIVLEVLDQRSRLRSFVKDLRLAFIDAATAAHRGVPWFVDVHLDAVLRLTAMLDLLSGGATRRRDRSATHPPLQTSRSRTPAQSHRGILFRAATRVRISAPSVALTIAPRYARPHRMPNARRSLVSKPCVTNCCGSRH